jgi:hypothetical protein
MKMTVKVASIIVFVLMTLLIAGCGTKSISDIKNEDMVGKTVSVKGTVESTVKLGSISGYTLKDDTDKISVSAKKLPTEGETVTVKGVLMKDLLLGYYLKADE